MDKRWSCDKANEWYKKQGWLRGCNFIGSDCANRLDIKDLKTNKVLSFEINTPREFMRNL